MNKFRYTPPPEYIITELPPKEDDEATVGGIIVPANVKNTVEKTVFAEVKILAVGDRCSSAPKVGGKAVVNIHHIERAGVEVSVAGIKYLCMQEASFRGFVDPIR